MNRPSPTSTQQQFDLSSFRKEEAAESKLSSAAEAVGNRVEALKGALAAAGQKSTQRMKGELLQAERILDYLQLLRDKGTEHCPTQQQFDLSSFRKELERRLGKEREAYSTAARRGWDEYMSAADGAVATLEGVLALLPGEGEQ